MKHYAVIDTNVLVSANFEQTFSAKATLRFTYQFP